VRDYHVGTTSSVHRSRAAGAAQSRLRDGDPRPAVLAAFLTNRLQAISKVPLLNCRLRTASAIAGGTIFRGRWHGRRRRSRLVKEEARIMGWRRARSVFTSLRRLPM
jgi:hypothetical protein